MAICDFEDCKESATRLVRDDSSRPRPTRQCCKFHAKQSVDTQRLKLARGTGTGLTVQRLPHYSKPG